METTDFRAALAATPREGSRLDGSLTARQLLVLRFIRDFIAAKGFSPTVREIGAAFGITSNAASDYLHALQAKGRITWAPRLSRTIRVVEVAT